MISESKEKSQKSQRKPRLSDDQIAEALRQSACRVSLAAEKLGYTFGTVHKRIRDSEYLQEIVEHERELMVDLAESQLKRAVIKGDAWAVCFTLKCLAKARGYVEKQMVEHSGRIDGHNVSIEVQIQDNWYGNIDRLTECQNNAAEGIAPPDTGPAVSSDAQGSSVRPPLGQNGSGSNGNDNGARPS
jgi:hypothetical protein